jgi:AraC-like DNA-binding protein
LSKAQQLALWWQHNHTYCGRRRISLDEEAPLTASIAFAQLGPVSLGQINGSVKAVERTTQDVAADSDDRYSLVVNHGTAKMRAVTRGRDAVLAPGEAVLRSHADPGLLSAGRAVSSWTIVIVPRMRLIRAAPGADDAVGRVLPAATETIRFISRYGALLLGDDALSDEPLQRMISTNLSDLVALGIGSARTGGDNGGAASLRAARLDGVIREIGLQFIEPDFSPTLLGAKLGLSVRYIHQLLQETGVSFTERVLELRLTRAMALLAGGAPKVCDAAMAAGFNDVSYFNRCFRRRFGMTPTAARGS